MMHIGKANARFDYYMQKNVNEVTLINKCTKEKDIGVSFDENLSFDAHIQSTINKANSMTGIIRRTFTYLNKNSLVKLYCALVRPHVEYGVKIWFPYLKRQSVAVEKVQRRATKILNELQYLTYTEKMKKLSLPSLKYRRIRGDMIFVYKLMNGLVNIDWHDFFTMTKSDITRGAKHKLFVRYSRTSMRKYTFSNRAVPVWNEISANTKSAQSLNSFKNLLDNDPVFKIHMYEYDG